MPSTNLDGDPAFDARSQEVTELIGREAVNALAYAKKQPFLGGCPLERAGGSNTKVPAVIE
ncbi:hypothetical protein D3C71_2124360 [compost metagenome]